MSAEGAVTGKSIQAAVTKGATVEVSVENAASVSGKAGTPVIRYVKDADLYPAIDAYMDEHPEIPAATTAEVGQIIVVKSVDENGKPTEWEVENIPSSQVNKTVSIIDITDSVVDGKFDFISAGQGIYFSSATIEFNFLSWDENYENYKRMTTYRSGLFLVSYQTDNGWFVCDISRMTAYLQIGDAPLEEGCYDMSCAADLTPQ